MKTACLFPNDPKEVASSSFLARWGFAAFLALAGGCSGDPSGVVAGACETELLWAVRAGGPGDDAGGILRSDKGTLVAGTFSAPATFGTGELAVTLTDGGPCFLASYDSDGRLQWARAAAGIGQRDGEPICDFGRFTPDGGRIVWSYFLETATLCPGEPGEKTFVGSDDMLLAKLNPDGTLAWAVSAGGVDLDRIEGLTVAMDGSIFLTGSFSSTATFGAGGPTETTLTAAGAELVGPEDLPTEDILVARYDTDGALVWVKQAGGQSGGFGIERGMAIAVAPDGGVLVTGMISSVATFGAGEANETTLTPTGEDLLSTSADIFVARYEPDGRLAWAKRVGGDRSEFGGDLQIAADGSVMVSGSFEGVSTFGAGEPAETTLEAPATSGDAFVAKYESNGALRWVIGLGSELFGVDGQDFARALAVDRDGTTFLTVTALAYDLDQSFPLVAALDTDGVVRWIEFGEGDASVGGMALDFDGNPVVVGRFAGPLTWRPGQPDETTLVAEGEVDPTGWNSPKDISVAKFRAACPIDQEM